MNISDRQHQNSRIACFVIALLILTGCAQSAPKATNIHLTGVIQGQQMETQAGAAVAAHIDCDQHATTASANGTFTLTIPINKDGLYTCTVSATSTYQPLTIGLAIPKAGNYVLNFIANTSILATAATSPSCTTKGLEYDCPLLQFTPGKIIATLTYHESKRPVPNAHLRCAIQHATGSDPVYFSNFAAQGDYEILYLPPGIYTCIAYDPDFVMLPPITVGPAQTATTQVSICEQQCPQLRFHNGNVMHHVTAYLIFWLPAGTTFGAAAYAQKMAQFLADVSNTPYLNVLTQYGDVDGPIQNTITLADTYTDTQPYPHAGTRADPLTDIEIQNEIARVKGDNSTWKQTPDTIFVIFTGYNIETCTDYSCSFDATKGFCGYHSKSSLYSPAATNPLLYALVLDTAACADRGATPNGATIDTAIDTLDHEIAEAATDPDAFSGWYNDALSKTPKGGEIGDLCAYKYFATLADGGNVTLHGHDYLVQPLWSNRINACSYNG